MSLSVLKQLGIYLYSTVPPVISEAVANSWDADADEVEINISNDEIVIEDNGHGMTIEDANKKYLFIGYERRKDKGEITDKWKRKAMGRKGIGKLSLFSIAKVVEVHSVKAGERHGFRMNVNEIEKQIKEGKGHAEYLPKSLSTDEIRVKNGNGTIIVLKELRKKRLTKTTAALKKRIARRFGIIGKEYHFTVKINGVPIAIEDRDYFKKIQYIWYFGEDSDKYKGYCDPQKLKYSERRENKIKIIYPNGPGKNEETFHIAGWIGTVNLPSDLEVEEENLNKIVIMVRGKLAQEDILEDFSEGRIFSKYLIGEIYADFLDSEGDEDAATSNRQEIIKDDPRYEALKKWVNSELKYIGNKWTDLRNKSGTERALKIKAINNWFNTLIGDDKKYAQNLFGKINQITIDSEYVKNELFKQSVLAFENLKYRRKLALIEKINTDNLNSFTEVLADYDDIEATMYYQITKGRIGVIQKFQQNFEKNVLEKIIQKYLYDHLWLLDPSWDRATETPLMEQQVKKEFGKIDAGLNPEEDKGRFDLKYKNPSGKHIIIELKRSDRTLSKTDIIDQAEKYRDTLKKCLKAAHKEDEPVEIIVLIGKPLKDWADKTKIEESKRMFETINTRVITYQQLIEDAYRAYNSFLEKNKEIGKLRMLIEEIETELLNN